MPERKDLEAKRSTCWNNALQACGTAYIFQQRAARLRLLSRVTKFLGIAVPLVVGFIATKVYTKEPVPEAVMFVASSLSLVLLLVSVWGLIAKWDDSYADAIQATQKNAELQQRWELLAKERAETVESTFDALQAEDLKQADSDAKQLPTPQEKRAGMRAGLLKYQRACAVCKQVPKSMSTKGGNCDVCC